MAKLYEIVSEPTTDYAIHWDEDGTSFNINDKSKFSSELMRQYFRTDKWTSFTRQLHLYGFKRSNYYKNTALFKNEFFVRGRKDLLVHIEKNTKSTKKNEVQYDSNSQ